MNSVLRFSRLSRTVPLVPNAEGFFDFHDIAEVARAIAQDQTHDSRMCFRHHSSDVRITFDQVASRMANLYGGHIEKVDLAAWIRRARDLGMEELIVSYLEVTLFRWDTRRMKRAGGCVLGIYSKACTYQMENS